MVKSIYTSYGNFISKGKFTVLNAGVTNDGTTFTFPTNTSHLYSIKLTPETAMDEVAFKFRINITNVVAASKIGLLLKAATDNVEEEAAMFVIGDGKVSFYWKDTKLNDFESIDITQFNNKDIDIEISRKEGYYYFKFQGKTYSKVLAENGTYYKQNIKCCVYGSNIKAQIKDVQYYTTTSPKFVIVGDSIVNGYAPTGALMADTIKGILSLEKGVSIQEFCGDANVIKDTLDSISDLVVLKPQYGIIFYGHNDTYFNTGRFQSDYKKLIGLFKSLGITPIICTITQSTWIDTTIPNNFLISKFFNDDFLHIDLRTVLTTPTDFIDGLHPTIVGNRKLADAIYNYIKDL